MSGPRAARPPFAVPNRATRYASWLRLALELVDHMNGRIYDPLLGRFLSADLFVQTPSNLQSYNRYTYVLNRPLNLTDPSGFFSIGFSIHGHNIVDGVHESIVEDSYNQYVNYVNSSVGGFPGSINSMFGPLQGAVPQVYSNSKLLSGLKSGVKLPDAPEGYQKLGELFLDEYMIESPTLQRLANIGVHPKESWTVDDFSRAYAGSPSFDSHFGANQFWHFMSDGKHSPAEIREAAIRRIASLTVAGRAEMKKGNYEKAGILFGAGLHTVQDSYARGHVLRDASGKILYIQDYNEEDHDAHRAADNSSNFAEIEAAKGPSAKTLQRMAAPGFVEEEFKEFLRKEIFPLAPDAKAVGATGEMSKK